MITVTVDVMLKLRFVIIPTQFHYFKFNFKTQHKIPIDIGY